MRALLKANEAVRALRSERSFLKILSEGVPAGLLLADRAGRIVTANRWLCRTLRTRKADLLGRRVTDILEPAGGDEAVCRSHLSRALSGESSECQAFLHGDTGGGWSVRVRLLPRHGAAGRRLVLLIVEDLSPRVEAAAARRQLREEFHAARAVAGWVTAGMRLTPTAAAVARFWASTSGADLSVLWLAGNDGRWASPGAVEAEDAALRRIPARLALTPELRRRREPWTIQRGARGRHARRPGVRAGTATVVWVPLPAPDGLLGLVQLGYRSPRPVPGSELDRFFLLAQSAAVAVRAAQQVEALAEKERRLRELSRGFLAAQEADRRRIAAELHDEIGNALTAIKVNLSLFERGVAPIARRDRSQAKELSDLVDRTLAEVRRIVQDLRPSLLDDLGLVPAVRTFAHEFARRAGLVVGVRVTRLDTRLLPESETALFRAVQEGLTNVVRHAGADRAEVRLTRRDGWIEASVTDNGRRRAVAETEDAEGGGRRGGTGIAGLSERLTALGGSVALRHLHRGTRLLARVPAPALPRR